MKPSEFLKKINVDVIGDLSELDKRFIDINEIKKEIKISKEEARRRGLI